MSKVTAIQRGLDSVKYANDEWQRLLIEDRTASPADIATIRIDFRAWLRTLNRQQRRVARRLAAGESVQVVAKMFGLTPDRVSQLRRELERDWLRFQGESHRESVSNSACA